MSSGLPSVAAPDKQSQEEDLTTHQKCLLCSKPMTSDLFTPYCSLKCAKEGTKRRYSLLSTFIDFESKYIDPPKKPILPPKATQEPDDASGVNDNKPKKVKR